jgi:hypothetical protein
MIKISARRFEKCCGFKLFFIWIRRSHGKGHGIMLLSRDVFAANQAGGH